MTSFFPRLDIDALPRRPRLLAGIQAFRRSDHEMQFGLDRRHAAVIADLPEPVCRVLCSLDGTMTVPALLHRAGRDHERLLLDVLIGLTAHGLLDDGAAEHRRQLWQRGRIAGRDLLREWAVAVRGEGALVGEVATLLAAAGVGHIVTESVGKITHEDVRYGFTTTDVGRSRKACVNDKVRGTNPATSTVTLASARSADLVVLTDSLAPPPEVTRQLVCELQPHLAVRVRDGIGIIGPLVFPGRSSCLHCADLHRADLDPCWARIVSQLNGRTQRADPVVTRATAAFAVGQILPALQPVARPSLWNATAEFDPYRGTTRWRHWSPHPRCDCGAT